MLDQLVLNKYGYYELQDMPSEEELAEWYATQYYQDCPIKSYEKSYTKAEIEYFFNKIEQKFIIVGKLAGPNANRFLDIGCGEGWALSYFSQKGWDITGLDYSAFGCERHNSDCVEFLVQGNVLHNTAMLVKDARTFDCIWLDNVLEHVTDPLALLENIRQLMSPGGVLMIDVPNDFSKVQKELLDRGLVSKPYWFAPFEHVSYFNKDGLLSLCEDANLKCRLVMTDYPIDFALFGALTNYVETSGVGRACHLQRVEIENFLHRQSPEKTNRLYEVMADLGIGREIIGFFILT